MLIGVALVEHRGCFLVGKRPEGTPLAGCDEFPGGKAHPGETPEDCAVRECLEETGLTVRAVARFALVEHEYAHGQVQLTFVRCEPADPASESPLPPFRWVPRSELAALNFPAANREIVQRLLHDNTPAAGR